MTARIDLMERARLASVKRAEANAASRQRAAQAVKARADAPPQKIVQRKTGLQWLLSKGRITAEESDIGEKVGAIFSEAWRAENPGSREPGMPSCRSSAAPSLAEWRLDAITMRRALTETIQDRLHGDQGIIVVRTLEQICHVGLTARDLAGRAVEQARAKGETANQDIETVRVEERLKLGLSLVEAILRTPAAAFRRIEKIDA